MSTISTVCANEHRTCLFCRCKLGNCNLGIINRSHKHHAFVACFKDTWLFLLIWIICCCVSYLKHGISIGIGANIFCNGHHTMTNMGKTFYSRSWETNCILSTLSQNRSTFQPFIRTVIPLCCDVDDLHFVRSLQSKTGKWFGTIRTFWLEWDEVLRVSHLEGKSIWMYI